MSETKGIFLNQSIHFFKNIYQYTGTHRYRLLSILNCTKRCFVRSLFYGFFFQMFAVYTTLETTFTSVHSKILHFKHFEHPTLQLIETKKQRKNVIAKHLSTSVKQTNSHWRFIIQIITKYCQTWAANRLLFMRLMEFYSF